MRILSFFILVCLHGWSLAQDTVHAEIYFELKSADISWEGERTLDSVIALLDFPPELVHITVDGHSDQHGTAKKNFELCEERNEQVVAYFKHHGFATSVMETRVFGSTRMKYPPREADPEQKDRNRRCEITAFALPPELQEVVTKEEPNNVTSFPYQGNVSASMFIDSNTWIQIPADGFVDDSGKVVKDELEVRVKVYRNPLEFAQAGASMHQLQTLAKASHARTIPGMLLYEVSVHRKLDGTPVHMDPQRRMTIYMRIPAMKNMRLIESVDHLTWKTIEGITDKNGKPSKSLGTWYGCGTNMHSSFGLMGEDQRDYILSAFALKLLRSPVKPWSQMQALGWNDSLRAAYQTEIDSLNRLRWEMVQQGYSLRRQYDETLHHPQIKIRRRKKDDLIAVSLTSKAKQNNAPRALGNAHAEFVFPVALQYEVEDSVFKLAFDHVEINTTGNGYYGMVMHRYHCRLIGHEYDGHPPLHLDSLQLRRNRWPHPMTAKKQAAVINAYHETQDRQRRDLDSLHEAYLVLMDSAGAVWTKAREMKHIVNVFDSCRVFWEYSKMHMTEEERAMDYWEWWAFFEQNPSLMKERYEPIYDKMDDLQGALREESRRSRDLDRFLSRETPVRIAVDEQDKHGKNAAAAPAVVDSILVSMNPRPNVLYHMGIQLSDSMEYYNPTKVLYVDTAGIDLRPILVDVFYPHVWRRYYALSDLKPSRMYTMPKKAIYLAYDADGQAWISLSDYSFKNRDATIVFRRFQPSDLELIRAL